MAGVGAREIQRVGQEAQQGLAGIEDGLDVGRQLVLADAPRQDVGHREHAVQGRADLVAHHRQELRLGVQRRLGLGLGRLERVGELGHLQGVVAVGAAGGLEQGQRAADAGVLAVLHHDEALHQLRRPLGQDLTGEHHEADVALHHQGLGVHQHRDGTLGVEGAAIFGGHADEEGVALDDADRSARAIDHRQGQHVGFALEALVDRCARRGRQHRLYRLGQTEKLRHATPSPGAIYRGGDNRKLKSQDWRILCFYDSFVSKESAGYRRAFLG